MKKILHLCYRDPASRLHNTNTAIQGRSQDFSKGGAEVMEVKALKRKTYL